MTAGSTDPIILLLNQAVILNSWMSVDPVSYFKGDDEEKSNIGYTLIHSIVKGYQNAGAAYNFCSHSL